MGSSTADLHRLDVAQRRGEREAKRHQKELQRRLKEQAKLSALEQARLEVEAHENELDVLLSIHKERSAAVDWRALASGLPPHEPARLARHELAALATQTGVEEAREVDEREYQNARARYETEFAQWEKMHSLARRVLAGEPRAYTEAVSESSALTEISNLGSSIHMTVHDARVIECELKVKGRDVIPTDVKSLTSTGKLVVKAILKTRFHEIYQDYVCGCVLRLAREMFALLPVDTVILTATVDGIDSRTGHTVELPVLSVAATRSEIERLTFEHLDPSDAFENFQHRGDVMTSRKSGEFIPIIPLSPADVASPSPETMDFTSLVARVKEFRGELGAVLKPAVPEGIALMRPSDSTS
jgi:hypothetical protein